MSIQLSFFHHWEIIWTLTNLVLTSHLNPNHFFISIKETKHIHIQLHSFNIIYVSSILFFNECGKKRHHYRFWLNIQSNINEEKYAIIIVLHHIFGMILDLCMLQFHLPFPIQLWWLRDVIILYAHLSSYYVAFMFYHIAICISMLELAPLRCNSQFSHFFNHFAIDAKQFQTHFSSHFHNAK